MAIVFQMWAEAADETGCDSLIAHFKEMRTTLLGGRTLLWEVRRSPDLSTAMIAWTRDLSRDGVRTVQDAVETSEAGLRLYHHLMSAPPFTYARAAWEAELMPLSYLPDWIKPISQGRCRLDLRCVLDEASYKNLGSPEDWVSFRPGYLWNRYSGEEYHPLGSGDQTSLNALRVSLFPNYWAR